LRVPFHNVVSTPSAAQSVVSAPSCLDQSVVSNVSASQAFLDYLNSIIASQPTSGGRGRVKKFYSALHYLHLSTIFN
jgi:hypothetical protein